MNIRLGHFLIAVLLMDMIKEQNQIFESILTWVLDPGRRPAYSVRKHYPVWPVQDDAYCNRVRGCTT